MPPDLIVVNDRADKEATEQLTITSKTVLINTGGGGTDVSDYGRATEEDLRDFFFRTATETTAPATASSVYFEPEVARTTTESTENREGEDQTTTKTPDTTPAAATIPPKYFEVFDYPSSTTAESQSSTTATTPEAEGTTPISSVYFDPEVRTPRTTTPPAALQAAVSDPEVIWYGDWEPAAAAAAGDDEGDTERYPPPQYEVIYFTDVNPSSRSESPTATTTSTSTTTTTTTASPTTSASHTSQRISTETQVRI